MGYAFEHGVRLNYQPLSLHVEYTELISLLIIILCMIRILISEIIVLAHHLNLSLVYTVIEACISTGKHTYHGLMKMDSRLLLILHIKLEDFSTL